VLGESAHPQRRGRAGIERERAAGLAHGGGPRGVRARIRSATVEELERWAMRVLEGSAVDEVFVEP
jgi:hypothetical protein